MSGATVNGAPVNGAPVNGAAPANGSAAPDPSRRFSLRHTAHDSEVPVGKWRLWVRRDLDLWRRIEQRFGALDPLEARLRTCALTLAELTDLYQIALARQSEKFSADAIGDHIVKVGITQASLPMQMLVLALGFGNEKAAEAFGDPYAEDGDEEPDGVRPPGA